MSNRNLIKAVSWLSLGNVMVRALSLLSMPILTHFLSPDAYGVATLVGTLVSLLSVFALAGMDMSYTRHAFSGEVGDPARVESFCWRWVLGSAAAVSLFAGILWWQLASRFALSAYYAGYVCVGVFFSTLMTMSQARARLGNRYKRLAAVQFVVGCIVATAGILIAMKWRQDATALLVAMLLGYALPVLLLGTPKWADLASSSTLKGPQRKSILATGLAGIVTAPAYWVLSSSDRWFLAAYHDHAVVGIYAIAFTVGTIGVVVSNAITAAWLPELSREESSSSGTSLERKQEMIHLLFALLLVVAVAVCAAGGDVIRALADQRFHSAVASVPWLAFGVLFYGVMHVGNALLVMKSKLHLAALAWAVSLAASVALNSWLVPQHGAQGAAIVQAFAFFLVMVLVWGAVLRVNPQPLQSRRLLAGLAIGVLAAGIMQSQWFNNPWLSLAAKFPAGVVVAFSCMWIIAPAAFRLEWRKFKGVD